MKSSLYEMFEADVGLEKDGIVCEYRDCTSRRLKRQVP
jgi:hypothetical protein